MDLKSNSLYLSFVFISLIILQVVVLNNINLFGYINPYLYIVFIFIYPINSNKITFLTISFILGLLIDFFLDSGGINAIATVTIAYIRPYFFKLIFKKIPEENDFFNFSEEYFGKTFNYITILTIVHHLIVFSLINFSFYNILKVLLNTIFSSIFTLFLYFVGSYIFRRKV